MRYYIADPHFYHENLNDQMDRRGFANVEEMNRYMIDRWKMRVRKNDDVIILGDFSLGNAEETNAVLKQLPGRLYLIRGNHDYFLKKAEADLSRFVWIRDYAELKDNRRKVVLCHYPICEYNGMYRTDNGSPMTYMLYGHIHNTASNDYIRHYQEYVRSIPRISLGEEGERVPVPICMINCFCMYSDYTPLTLDEWIDVARRMGQI